MSRVRLAENLVDSVGRDVFVLDDAGLGWPAAATLRHADGSHDAADLYLAQVGLSQRGRDGVERRIQVKGGHPIEDAGTSVPVLLGVWDNDPLVDVDRPVLLAADARRRVGSVTQASVFIPLAKLQEAARLGWSTYRSSTGEVIECLVPALLPVLVESRRNAIVLDDRMVQAAVAGAGILEDDMETVPAGNIRARRASQVLVRDARFSRRVSAAYGGRCAMCGLGVGIVEAAHIVPAAAGTDDTSNNGIALCPNHHRLFDSHLVGVHPVTLKIEFAPSVKTAARDELETSRLIAMTLPALRRAEKGGEPRPAAFVERYTHFAGCYGWLGFDIS